MVEKEKPVKCIEFYNEDGEPTHIVCPFDENIPNPEFLYDAFEGMENGEDYYTFRQDDEPSWCFGRLYEYTVKETVNAIKESDIYSETTFDEAHFTSTMDDDVSREIDYLLQDAIEDSLK